MKLNFVKVNPVENMTVFILDKLDRKEHINIAKRLMNCNNLYAEQIGFVEKFYIDGKLNLRLQMMGGEFCGNATRSLAALCVYKDYGNFEEKDGKYFVNIETSGLEKVLKCEVEKTERQNIYLSKIQMPAPKKISKIDIELDGNKIDLFRIDFDGITHFVVNTQLVSNKNVFFDKIQCIMHDEEYDAFGIMFLDFETFYSEPLVYVKATDSLFWERSCASGATAIGVTLSYQQKRNLSLELRQPGGILQIETLFDGGDIRNIFLNGTVEIVAEGIVNL